MCVYNYNLKKPHNARLHGNESNKHILTKINQFFVNLKII